MCAVLEAPRLYIGYHGNLRERPPALAGFLLLTLLTMALVAFLGFSEPIPMVSQTQRFRVWACAETMHDPC